MKVATPKNTFSVYAKQLHIEGRCHLEEESLPGFKVSKDRLISCYSLVTLVEANAH